ncbi:MAG TPA: hypothetical protein PKD54_04810 [Pirellulaceae bacterium]|nr:hypothetical protein [Pirellulaceae bacterium]
MDPLRFTIACLPLAVYCLMLALLHLRQQPFVTTGARDSAALGIAIVGLVAVGPMELFFPEGAAIHFGFYIWPLLFLFYGLCVSLVVLLMRPRLVVYNVTTDQLRPLLTEIAGEMDQKSRWTADSLIIPNRRIHLCVESVEWLNTVQIVSTGSRQSLEGWRELESRLKAASKTVKVRPSVWGLGFLVVAISIAIAGFVWMALDTQSVAQVWRDLLRQ